MSKDEFWCQSRERILSLENDNAGFAFFVESKKEVFYALFALLCERNQIDFTDTTILTIYGEWAGKGIMKGAAIYELDKAFYIFATKVSNTQDNLAYWIDSHSLQSPVDSIYNVEKFTTFTMEIDTSNPRNHQNDLTTLTEEVERECPIAKAFGVSGTGEGIVWSAHFDNQVYRFKVKGEKHSVSKVKTLAPVDTEKLASIQEFLDYSVTENRLNQAITTVFEGKPIDRVKMGDVIRFMVNDITKEEMAVMVESGLEPKEVNSGIAMRTREWFYNKEKEDVGV